MQNLQKTISLSIIGMPNAGKSTLTNNLLGQKLSIVTPKVQTTRSIITAIVTIDNTQVILFDTPGIFEPKKNLEKAMVRCAWSCINDNDLVAFVIDSSRKLQEELKDIINKVISLNKSIIFLLNKIDLKSKYHIENLNYIDKLNIKNKAIFNISAINGTGVEAFKQYLVNNAKEENWLYNEDDITNLPVKFLSQEITREQLFLRMHQELPYNLTVETEVWKELDKFVEIKQIIIVTRESHKKMILGKDGANIKHISIKARENIEYLIQKKVHLSLFIKVRKNWDSNPLSYQNMNLKLTK